MCDANWIICDKCKKKGEVIAESPMGDSIICKCPNGHIWKI